MLSLSVTSTWKWMASPAGDLVSGLFVDVADGDLRAFARELQGGRMPDARACARDDRHFVHQPHLRSPGNIALAEA
jgi:hypothetical protein